MKKIFNNKYLWLYLGIIVVVGSALGIYSYQSSKDTAPEAIYNQPELTADTSETPKPKVLPVSANLQVPYAAQAPFGNWTVHEESCEEAALVMYKEYLTGNKVDSKLEEGSLDVTYRDMKSWQNIRYGKEPDLTMEALGKFANEYYGLKYTTTSATESAIKEALVDGRPVVVPVMTHSLENNMYGRYSVYHVLFIKGYDSTGVITNDAGVGNGQNHHYTWDVLWRAIDAQTSHMDGQGRVMLTLAK